MAKVTEISEHFQHFVGELQDSFWGDVYGRMRVAWQQFWNGESLRARDQWMELDPYQRAEGAREYRNGFYERDYVTRFGTIRLRIARTRSKKFSASGSFLHKRLDITSRTFMLTKRRINGKVDYFLSGGKCSRWTLFEN